MIHSQLVSDCPADMTAVCITCRKVASANPPWHLSDEAVIVLRRNERLMPYLYLGR